MPNAAWSSECTEAYRECLLTHKEVKKTFFWSALLSLMCFIYVCVRGVFPCDSAVCCIIKVRRRCAKGDSFAVLRLLCWKGEIFAQWTAGGRCVAAIVFNRT